MAMTVSATSFVIKDQSFQPFIREDEFPGILASASCQADAAFIFLYPHVIWVNFRRIRPDRDSPSEGCFHIDPRNNTANSEHFDSDRECLSDRHYLTALRGKGRGYHVGSCDRSASVGGELELWFSGYRLLTNAGLERRPGLRHVVLVLFQLEAPHQLLQTTRHRIQLTRRSAHLSNRSTLRLDRRRHMLSRSRYLLCRRTHLLSTRCRLLAHRSHTRDPRGHHLRPLNHLLDRTPVLRSHLLNRHHRLLNAANTRRHLTGDAAHRLHLRGHQLRRTQNVGQRSPCLLAALRSHRHLGAARLHRLHRLIHFRTHRTDETADLTGRTRGALGQLAHLIGDHREALAMLARTRRLDGRIQRQQVGLLGDLVDGLDNRSDLLAFLAQLLHLLRGLLHLLLDALHARHCLLDRLTALLRHRSRFLSRDRHLLSRARYILYRSRRLLHSLVRLLDGSALALGAGLHPHHHLAQLIHGLSGLGGGARLILAADGHLLAGGCRLVGCHRHFLDVVGDLGGGLSGLLGGGGELSAGGSDEFGAGGDFSDEVAQLGAHPEEGLSEGILVGLGLDLMGHVSIGDGFSGLSHGLLVGDDRSECLTHLTDLITGLYRDGRFRVALRNLLRRLTETTQGMRYLACANHTDYQSQNDSDTQCQPDASIDAPYLGIHIVQVQSC